MQSDDVNITPICKKILIVNDSERNGISIGIVVDCVKNISIRTDQRNSCSTPRKSHFKISGNFLNIF